MSSRMPSTTPRGVSPIASFEAMPDSTSYPIRISVAIADDHPVFRQGVSTLLALEEDIEVIAMAENGLEAIEMLDREDPDILLLDLRMPDLDGLGALRRLAHKERRTRVIVLTASEDQIEYVQAISDGAAGVLLKQTAVDCLADCIRSVHAGDLWVDNAALPLPDEAPLSDESPLPAFGVS